MQYLHSISGRVNFMKIDDVGLLQVNNFPFPCAK